MRRVIGSDGLDAVVLDDDDAVVMGEPVLRPQRSVDVGSNRAELDIEPRESRSGAWRALGLGDELDTVTDNQMGSWIVESPGTGHKNFTAALLFCRAAIIAYSAGLPAGLQPFLHCDCRGYRSSSE